MITALLVATSTLMMVGNANAIAISVDNTALTVVRPTSGTTQVNFTGHITISDGFEITSATSSSLWTAGGTLISSVFPDPTFNLDGILWSVTVSATDALGLYAFDSSLSSPAFILFSECPIGGGFCNSTGRINYSVNIVDSLPVPEPTPVILLGLGLLSLGIMHSRRRSRRGTRA